jgi:hypothetical protein
MEVEALLRITRGQRKEESKTKRRQPGDKHTVFKENTVEQNMNRRIKRWERESQDPVEELQERGRKN